MDPNETLKRILAICEAMQLDPHSEDELAELLTALDAWIVRGGFLPARWQPKPAKPTRHVEVLVVKDRRRIERQERCLHAVLCWIREREDHFGRFGADRLDNENFTALMRLRKRVWKTLIANDHEKAP